VSPRGAAEIGPSGSQFRRPCPRSGGMTKIAFPLVQRNHPPAHPLNLAPAPILLTKHALIATGHGWPTSHLPNAPSLSQGERRDSSAVRWQGRMRLLTAWALASACRCGGGCPASTIVFGSLIVLPRGVNEARASSRTSVV
jgi:hypothetical protein